MAVDPSELEAFVSDATRALGGEWSAPGGGVFVARFPEACAKALEGACERRLTFDRERFAAGADDGLEFVTTGAPLLAQLTAALRERGVLARAAGNGKPPGKGEAEARLGGALRIRNGTAALADLRNAADTLLLFTFRAVFQTLERFESLHGVAVDSTGRAFLFDPARLLTLSMTPVEPPAGSEGRPTASEVDPARAIALEAVRAAVEPERKALSGKLAARREAEEAQLTEYFRGLGAELVAQRAATPSEKIRAEIGERLATIDRERDLRLAEVRERYEAKVDLVPVSLLVVEAPTASATVALAPSGSVTAAIRGGPSSGAAPEAALARRAPEGERGGPGEGLERASSEQVGRAARAALRGPLRVDLHWIPLIDFLSLPPCPVCSAPVSEGSLCEDLSGLHLVCMRCTAYCPEGGEARCAAHLRACVVCATKFCESHVVACAAGHGDCCFAHRATCSKCRKVFCTSHTVLCAKCSAPSCETDRRPCIVCKKPFCEAHVSSCAECAAVACETDRRTCSRCGKTFCTAHVSTCFQCSAPVCETDRRFCAACRRSYCPSHVGVCDITGRPFCASHGRRCVHCRQEYLAEAVRPDGRCKACAALAPSAIDDPAVAMARHHRVLAGVGNWQSASTRTKFILTASTFFRRYRVIISKTDGRILEASEAGKLFGGEKPLSL
ncbi:MAG: hypothetical protein HYY93_07650 [Planctomycetes bacterium]|nr:hypothetical protein [Planctomycetota bacterium]